MRLRLTIPLGDLEPPAGFACRLAAANGLTASEFCRDWCLSLRQIAAGDAVSIAKIAELGGADAATLIAHAFVPLQKGRYRHRGEILARSATRQPEHIRVCARCLSEDIEAHSGLDPDLAGHARAPWSVDTIRTCIVHDIALTEIPVSTSKKQPRDMAWDIGPIIPKLTQLIASAPERCPTGLEIYVSGRLAGGGQTRFLDALPLFAAIRLCEMIGAVSMFGPRVRLSGLDDGQWHLAGAQGFVIVEGGSAGIEAFLRDIMTNSAVTQARNDGAPVIFGVLYDWLAHTQHEPAYDLIREIVRGFVIHNLPVGHGDKVFGVRADRRALHSLRTLSVENGVHPKRLRKLLRAADAIDERQMTLSDHCVLFDTRSAADAIALTKTTLSLPEVRRHLNLTRSQADLLVHRGFINPHADLSRVRAYARYAIADLDAFLHRLTQRAHPVARPMKHQGSISAIAKRACCSAADIVRLILDERLPWVGKLDGARGFAAVIVDAAQVKAAVRGPDHDGVSLRAVSRILGTTDRVVGALIVHKHLAAFTAINPVNRCPQTVVAAAEVERFRKDVVSLHVLAMEQGRHHLAMKASLDAKGVRTAFDREEIGASFYRRDLNSK